MSSVVQTQMVTQVAATLGNGAVTTIDIPRPQTTPQEPAYAEGTDYVVRPTFLREEEGGHVVIDLPAAFVAANVFLRRASIRQLLPPAQKGVTSPANAFFPTGAPTDSTFVRDLVNLGTANTLATNADAMRDLLGNLRAAATVRSFPGITLMSGQYVRLEIYQNTGAPIGPGMVNATYKLGLSQGDTGKP